MNLRLVSLYFFSLLFFIFLSLFTPRAFAQIYQNCYGHPQYCIDSLVGNCWSLQNRLFPVQTQPCPAGSTLITSGSDVCAGTNYNVDQCGAQGGCGFCSYPGQCCFPNSSFSCYTAGYTCHNGPPPNGYQYDNTNTYTCPPSFDGCLIKCISAGTCPNPPDPYTSYVPDGNCGFKTCQPYCNSGGPVNCSNFCGNGYEPTNTCGAIGGTKTCQHNQNTTGDPNASACIINSQSNYQVACTYSYNACSNNYTCPNINAGGNNPCVTNLTIHAYIDYPHNGTKSANYTNARVTLNGGNAQYTDGFGNTTFGGLTTGNYTVDVALLANYANTTTNPRNIGLNNGNGNSTVNFGITPLYSISGRVFNDTNKNQRFDGPDTGYGGGTIHITGPTAVNDMTAAADGTWFTPINLLSGNYTVSYTTSLAAGYRFTTPSSFVVTVGNPAGTPACSPGGSLDALCGGTNNGSISNLDIGLTNEVAWNQSACYDVRDDSGTYTDPIPAAPSCGGVSGAYDSITNGNCSTGAGIIFTCDATPDFSLGSANANNWHVGGPAATDKECFTGAGLDVIRTSYDYLLTTARESNITPIDMNSVTVCGSGGLGNCTLPSSLSKGVYKAEGDVVLNTYTFPVDPTGNPEGFIFLIHGNLYLNGNIIIPQGSVAVFSSSGNIIVDKSVGNVVTSTTDPAVNNPNLEGLFSADGSFIVNSYIVGTNVCNADGTPLDKKLNIVGSIVTNAAKAGGSFLNNRDLCIYDPQCSSVSAGDNNGLALSYLLTLFADGKFLNHKLFNWQELRP